MQSVNRIIISAAGSGKTTTIVKEAINKPFRKILIATYTINNCAEIKKKFYEFCGAIPPNVTVMTWFSFLLRECVRPYQNFVYDKRRIESIAFVTGTSAKFVRKDNIERYYFYYGQDIYTDKISEFACVCNEKSKGLVMARLSEVYDEIFIDEVQDLSGYDLELIELLLKSRIRTLLVGDHRQATYSTNNSPKNSGFKGIKIVDLFRKWEKQGLCEVIHLTQSHRCNQLICELADELYPGMLKTESRNFDKTGHDGIFLVSEHRLNEYMSAYLPKVLRYDRRTDCRGYLATNFGDSKGLTFDRVLIFPNGPIRKYLATGDIAHVQASIAKLYVAVTRARNSVAFLYDGQCVNIKFIPF